MPSRGTSSEDGGVKAVDRIKAAVAFQEAGRPPVIVQVFGHAAVLAGVPLKDYLSDGGLLALCQLAALDHYGYDAVFTVMGTGVESEALGSTLREHDGAYSTVEDYVFAEGLPDTPSPLPDPQTAGRMPEMLKALRHCRGRLGDEALVVGCVLGPFTLATQTMGLERALLLAVDDPNRFERLLDFTTDIAIRFGEAQIRAGAHLPLIFDPAASPAVIPPRLFRELEAPRLKRVFTAFARAGALTGWLHIAGPTKAIMPFYSGTGAGLACFDYCVAPEDAQEALPQTCLSGNIKPLAFVEAEPSYIRAESEALLAAFADRRGFILSSGCEVPLESRPENIAAMVAARNGVSRE